MRSIKEQRLTSEYWRNKVSNTNIPFPQTSLLELSNNKLKDLEIEILLDIKELLIAIEEQMPFEPMGLR